MTTGKHPEPSFTITKQLPATRENVWRAWTDHEAFSAWMAPYGVDPASVTLQPHFGGRYVYVMVNEQTGDQFPTGGVYLEVQPLQRLVFTWGEPGAAVESSPTIIIELATGTDETTTDLTFCVRGFDGEPGDGFVYDGWDRALANLEQYLHGTADR